MGRHLANIFRLGLKELRSLSRDVVMLALIFYTFTIAVHDVAKGVQTEVKNAAVAVIDDDGSEYSRRLRDAIQPPYFQAPTRIDRRDVDFALDHGTVTFVLDLPPNLEKDLLAGRQPEIGLDIDATAMTQAGVGAGYIENIISQTTQEFLGSRGEAITLPATVVTRAYFNPNLESTRFNAVMQVLENITILSVILVGAAVMRERERGTIEHLLVMPVTPLEIMTSKVWAMGLVVLLASGFSLIVVVKGLLSVPIEGSLLLFLCGAALHLFATTSMGIFMGTFVRSMPQFGLLLMLVLLPLEMLSGGSTPRESMPEFVQKIMLLAPTTHFVSFSQAILYRGAGFDVVWPSFLAIIGIGAAFFLTALAFFRKSIAAT